MRYDEIVLPNHEWRAMLQPFRLWQWLIALVTVHDTGTTAGRRHGSEK